MVGENGVPETPDWLPESRDNISVRVVLPLSEAITLWDQDWAHWRGDDG